MERGNGGVGVGVGVGVSVGVGFGGVYNVNDYSAGESPTKPIPLVAPSLAAVQIVRGIGVPKGPTEKAREAKRARRSEIERMSRQRRSGQYGSMREEVARLERQQANMIFRYESGATAPASGGVAARREQYLRAVTEVRKLREEQSRLRDMIHEHALLAISFHEMSETFLEEDMVTWESALTTWVDALTMDDAVAVMRESCRIAATFEGGGPWQSTGGQFMGWRDKRKLIESTSTMIHRFTKVFPGHRAQDLMEISWNKFCDEAFCQKTIVNASTSLQIHLLQELNDSIRVTRRRTQYEGLPHKSFHTVYVMFRIQTDDGFVICLKSIDAPEVQRSLGDHESWVDVFHWITFTNLTDENGDDDASGCEVTFGGTLQSGVRKFALHWLIESALAVVRWETACVAPHFILPGE